MRYRNVTRAGHGTQIARPNQRSYLFVLRYEDRAGAPATVRRRSRRRAAGIAGAALAMLALAFGVHALFDTRRPANELPRETLFAASTVSPAQWRATLEQQARRAPRDGRAWMLLARADFAAERYVDAAASYANAVSVSSNVARDPEAWCEYADALGMTQNGSLVGRPYELIMRALAIDPKNRKALEMAGSASLEQNDAAAAVEYWRLLVVQLPARSRERQELVAALAQAEELAASGARVSTPGKRHQR